MTGTNDDDAQRDAWAAPPSPEGPVPPPPEGFEPGAYTPGAADPAWGAAPQQKRGGGALRRVVVIGVIFAAFAGFGALRTWWRDNKDPFNTPTTIGTATLMTDAEATKLAKDAREEVENVHRAVSGIYAEGGTPQFLLIAGDADDDTARSLYDTFVKDAKKQNTTVGAATTFGKVLCASVEDQEAPAIACFWGSKKSDGILMHYGTDDPAEAGRLAQIAWDGVEA